MRRSVMADAPRATSGASAGAAKSPDLLPAAEPVSSPDHGASTVYWYPPESSRPEPLDVLLALRSYGLAEGEMRGRIRKAMSMNETDLAALHHLIHARDTGGSLGAKDLAGILEVSPASVSVMLERLERSGYVTRTVRLDDRRASVVEVTDDGAREVSTALGPLHTRILAVASALPVEDAGAVHRFLMAMRLAVETVDSDPA